MSALNVHDVGEGPVAVLLHAFPCDARMWRPQADALSLAGWRVLVPDLPGFGGSELLDDEPRLGAVADAVVSMLDERSVDRCVLAGVSLGGYVAMAMLASRPDLAAAVVFCDTKATADGDAARENRERLAVLCEQDPAQTARILEQSVLPGLLGETTRATRPDVVAEVRGWLGEARSETVAWYQRAMAARPDSRDVLASLEVPALVVWGDEDALSPRAEQDLMLERLVHGDVSVIAGAGHLANVECPDEVSWVLRRFGDVVRGHQQS